MTTAFVSIQKRTALSAINFVMDGREENYLKRFFHCLVFLILAPWFTKHSKHGTNLVIFYEVMKYCWTSLEGEEGKFWEFWRWTCSKAFFSLFFFCLQSIWLSFPFLVSHLTKSEPLGKPHRYPPFDLPLLKGDATQTRVVCQITVGMIPLTAQDPVNSYPSCVQKRISRR